MSAADLIAAATNASEFEAAYQAEAEETAARHNYDCAALDYHYRRYQFGSLANNYEAADMRRKYWRAMLLAQDRRRAAARDVLQAAE